MVFCLKPFLEHSSHPLLVFYNQDLHRNALFGLPAISLSVHPRHGWPLVFSEFVATFGLLLVIRGCSRFRPSMIPVAVGSYITAAYWFTASTSFANPAVTIARSLTNTFSGIRPVDVPWFLTAQFCGGMAATLLFGRLRPTHDHV